jgi:hypothetical protein
VGGLPTFGVWWLKKEGLRGEIEKKEKSSFSFSYLLTLFFSTVGGQPPGQISWASFPIK